MILTAYVVGLIVIAGILILIAKPSTMKVLLQIFDRFHKEGKTSADSGRPSQYFKGIVEDYIKFCWGEDNFVKGVINTLTYLENIQADQTKVATELSQ